MQKISFEVEEILKRISTKTDDLYSDEAASQIVIPSRKKVKVDEVKLNKLKIQLGDGIWVKKNQLLDHIFSKINKNEFNSITYSPLRLNIKELECCKPMTFQTGNIITGRDNEIEKILFTLCRSNKRGVILVGPPGTGKTAIVREINNRLIQNTVPKQLIGSSVLDMNIPLIFSVYKQDPIGTIVSALEAASKYDKAILFIDEVHQLLSNKMNDIMKPYLTEKIRFIGSTTIDEYHAIITEDKALERRFTVIHVEEPSIDKTISMVKGTKSIFEDHHKCTISNELCEYAVINASRFLGQRKNPDKSLDILDIACSFLSELEPKTVVPSIERTNDALDNIKAFNNELNGIHVNPGNRTLNEHYINLAISSVTGINYNDIKNSLNYNSILSQMQSKVFGQDNAVKCLSNIVNIFKHINYNNKKPVSTLLLVGESGVGKKHACKELTKCMYGTDKLFINYDMSGFTSEYSISELKGAPPGYVGYAKSGKLIKEIKNNPQSIVFFSKINRAHPSIIQYIIDSCSNGIMVDSAEREAQLNNTIIIYSVTLEKDKLSELKNGFSKTMGFGNNKNIDKNFSNKDLLKNIINNDLLEYSDEIVIFENLEKDSLEKIYESNVNNYLSLYKDIDIDMVDLKSRVLESSTNGKDVITKLSSIIPSLIFNKLKE